MPATIYLIRHAQGTHNLGKGDWTLHDPDLTPEGRTAALAIRDDPFLNQRKISCVIASPLRRTLHTAALACGPALEGETGSSAHPAGKCHPEILASSDAQEISTDPCDTGSGVEELKRLVAEKGWGVDLTGVLAGWNDKTRGTRYGPDEREVKVRARAVRKKVKEMVEEFESQGDEDVVIVVVTHGSFLHYLTEDWEDAALSSGTGWKNCEIRAYRFEEEGCTKTAHEDECRLIETEASRIQRGKSGVVLVGPTVRMQMYQTAMEQWKAQGLQRPDQIEDQD